MSAPAIQVIRARALKQELGDAMIHPLPSLASTAVLTDAKGARYYLPVYRAAAHAAGGREAFTPSLTDDGTLTLYLESSAPSEAAAGAGGAHPLQAGTAFSLVLDASGGGRRIPMQHGSEGDLHTLTTRLAGGDLKEARTALFDAAPNVAIEVTQTLTLAALETREFVDANWGSEPIRRGLQDAFGGIPFDSAAQFYRTASQSEDIANEYLVMKATYRALFAAPPLPGYIQHQVNWKDRAYNYYQDNRDPSRVFYLPERFEFAKGPAGAPTVSLLQFSLPDGDASVERTRATFRVYGTPVVDADRIRNAAQSLKDRLGAAPQMVSLQDAHHVKTTFTQYLPNAQATAGGPAVQANATINLGEGLRNELHQGFAQFRALWAAIFSTAPENPLFRGWVDVELSEGKFRDRIDFDGRLPADREASFFDSILDTSADQTYARQFAVKTVKAVFQGDPAVVEIEVDFPGAAPAVLSPETLESTVTVNRSIRDIVIGRQPQDEYPYRLCVVREDGTLGCCEGKARSTSPSLWLSSDQLMNCTGPCS